MVTANSPEHQLRKRSDVIAKTLKRQAQGRTGAAKFAIAMDDKFLTLEILWSVIQSSTEIQLSEFVLKQMREEREH